MFNSAIPLTPIEEAVRQCGDCRIWDDGKGFPEGEEFIVWTFRNGMTLDFGTGPIPLHSDYVLCPIHTTEAHNQKES